LRVLMRDVLKGKNPSYGKDPESVAYYVSADGDKIVRARGQKKITIPITHMTYDDVRASEATAVLIQSAASRIEPVRAYSYAEGVQLMAEGLQRRGLRLAHILADHKWRVGMPQGVRAVAAASVQGRIAFGLSAPETLGMAPIGEGGRVGMAVLNLDGIFPVEILPN